MNAVKTLCTDPRLVVGAGGAELAMAVRVTEASEKCTELDQYAMKKVGVWRGVDV